MAQRERHVHYHHSKHVSLGAEIRPSLSTGQNQVTPAHITRSGNTERMQDHNILKVGYLHMLGWTEPTRSHNQKQQVKLIVHGKHWIYIKKKSLILWAAPMYTPFLCVEGMT